jgi:hypothetical protein
MASLRNIDLGVLQRFTPVAIRRHGFIESVGSPGVFPQNLEAETITANLKGFLSSPSQAEREKVRGMQDGELALLDLNDEIGVYRWAKVLQTTFDLREVAANEWDYRMKLALCPGVGYTRALTDDMAFSDLSYHRKVRAFDPYAGYHNVSHSSLLVSTQEFYVMNLAGTEETLEFEVYVGDDLTHIRLRGWKNSAWDTIGTWGSGGTTFGNTNAWTDEDSDAHTFRVDHDTRGQAVTNFTEDVSMSLGNDRRAMIQISGMDAYVAASALASKVGDFQLLLEAQITHSQREATRPYPIVTYQDGGFGLGPA